MEFFFKQFRNPLFTPEVELCGKYVQSQKNVNTKDAKHKKT